MWGKKSKRSQIRCATPKVCWWSWTDWFVILTALGLDCCGIWTVGSLLLDLVCVVFDLISHASRRMLLCSSVTEELDCCVGTCGINLNSDAYIEWNDSVALCERFALVSTHNRETSEMLITLAECKQPNLLPSSIPVTALPIDKPCLAQHVCCPQSRVV